jgi:hypothetical protein
MNPANVFCVPDQTRNLIKTLQGASPEHRLMTKKGGGKLECFPPP